MSTIKTCPRCSTNQLAVWQTKRAAGDPAYGALSRTDDHTMICSDCGTHEALQDWRGTLTPQWMWPIEVLPWKDPQPDDK